MKRNKSFFNEEPLYLISTPIGNLGDFSSRALEIINSLDVIACEDTRNTKSLLDKFNIKKTLISLREHNEIEASNYVISLINEGKKVGYVSDAGYPCISDPGRLLAEKVVENDKKVSVIPGPSAFLSGLVASTLPTDKFFFNGFLSPKEKEKKDELFLLKEKRETIIFYESPHRIKETLSALYEVLGDRKATIARELTKLNEEYIYGTLKEFNELDPDTLIGEMVIVVEGNKNESTTDDKTLMDRVNYLMDKGLSHKDAAEITAQEYKVKKNYVYNLTVKK